MANKYRYRTITPGSAGAAMLVEEGMRRALTLPCHMQDYIYAALMAGGEVFAAAPESVVVSAPRPMPCEPISPHALEIVQYMQLGTRWQVRAALIAVNGNPATFRWDRRGRTVAIYRGGRVQPFKVTIEWHGNKDYENLRIGDYTVIHYMRALGAAFGPMLSGEVYE